MIWATYDSKRWCVKHLKTFKKASITAIVALLSIASFMAILPNVKAAPPVPKMSAGPTTYTSNKLHPGDLFNISVYVEGLSYPSTIACSMNWNPDYVNLTDIYDMKVLGPAGSFVIGDWDPVYGFASQITAFTTGNPPLILNATFIMTTWKVMRPGYSTVDIYEQNAFDLDMNTLLEGDCPNDCNLFLSEVLTHTIVYGSNTFYVTTESNATINPVKFDANNTNINFTTSGINGTGYVNVTIPKAMLWVDLAKEPNHWNIVVDATNITDWQKVENATHTFIYFKYSLSTHTAIVFGNSAVPEFYIPALILAMLIATTIAFVLTRKVHKRPWQTTLKR